MQIFSRRVVIATLVTLALLGSTVLYIKMAHPSRYLAADSFTYFAMARMYHDAGLWYSYTGVDHTTGAHPAYYFLTTLLYPLFGMDIPLWSFVFNEALLLLGLYLLYRALGFVPAVVMFVLAMTQQAASATNNGMESALLFLALAAALFIAERIGMRLASVRDGALLGFALGVVVAARLDAVFFVAAYLIVYALALLWRVRSAPEFLALVRSLVIVTVPLAAVVTGIVAVNWHFDGTLMPLSGELKSSFPYVTKGAALVDSFWALRIFIVSIIVSGAYLAWQLWRRAPLGALMPALFIASLALYLYNALFVYQIGAWYGALPFFTLALTLGLFARDIFALWPPRFAAWRVPVFFIGMIAASLLAVMSFGARDGLVDWVERHQRAAAHLMSVAQPGEAAAEFKDGIMAFYATSMPVYNLTGLGNNQEYARALQEGTLAAYLSKKHIKYIAGGSGSGIQVPGAKQYLTCRDPIYDQDGVKLYAIATCTVRSTGDVGPHDRMDVGWDE